MLSAASWSRSGFLRREPLERLVADQRAGQRDYSKQLWQLLTPRDLVPQHARSAGVRGSVTEGTA